MNEEHLKTILSKQAGLSVVAAAQVDAGAARRRKAAGSHDHLFVTEAQELRDTFGLKAGARPATAAEKSAYLLDDAAVKTVKNLTARNVEARKTFLGSDFVRAFPDEEDAAFAEELPPARQVSIRS